MALQAEPRTSSLIAGLPIYWQEATKPPELEWEKWIDLFEVALMAKRNISVAELTKTTGTKDKSLMGDMEEATAMKKSQQRTVTGTRDGGNKNHLRQISNSKQCKNHPGGSNQNM